MAANFNFKTNTKLEILWTDSFHRADDWYSPEEVQDILDNYEEYIVHTIGYYLDETETHLFVIQSFDSQESCNVDAIMAIPKSVINEINELDSITKK